MSIYLVRNPEGQRVWVAYEDDQWRLWTFVQNTGMFHLNQGVYLDFYFEHENSYEPITAEAARQIIQEGVGRVDPEVWAFQIHRYRDDADARTVEDVLGAGIS